MERQKLQKRLQGHCLSQEAPCFLKAWYCKKSGYRFGGKLRFGGYLGQVPGLVPVRDGILRNVEVGLDFLMLSRPILFSW
jgi:hypothetical protein